MNMLYIQKLCNRFHNIEFRHTPYSQNELDDSLVNTNSMNKHPNTDYIDPLNVEMKEHPVHYSQLKQKPFSLTWYLYMINELESGTYHENATYNQKRLIRCLALNFFLSREIL